MRTKRRSSSKAAWKPASSPRLDGGHDGVVELVEAGVQAVVEVVLALAGDADDHACLPSSPAGSWPASPPPDPAPSSAFIFASSSSTWLWLESCVQLAVDVVLRRCRAREVLERPGRLELGDRVGAGAHLLGLVDGALHGQADVGHLLADAGRRLGDPDLRLGGASTGP